MFENGGISVVPKEIEMIFRDKINPTLANHGGYAQPLCYQDGIVTIRMGGCCRGCLSQDDTINGLIRQTLRNECAQFPIQEVVVSDEVAPELLAMAKQILGLNKL